MSEASEPRGTYREADGTPIDWPTAVAGWAAAARVVLERTAGQYGTWLTYGELAEAVQAETGVRTRSLLPNWIGEVLARVAATQSHHEPALTSLVVRTDGTIGDGFLDVMRQREAVLPDDLELCAARERRV